MDESWQEYTQEAVQALIARVDAIEEVLLVLHLAERRTYFDTQVSDEVSPLLTDRPPMRSKRGAP